MTAPITGPFTKTEFLYDIPHYLGGNSAKQYLLERTWYRQQKPYDLPLNFESSIRRGKSRYVSTGPYGNYSGSSIEALAKVPRNPGMRQDIYNRAYAKFVAEMGERVQMGVATAEGRQALSMVTTRLTQMAMFTGNLARGKFGKAAGNLGINWSDSSKRFTKKPVRENRSKPRRETVRDFSQLYLEAHFGWSPLMQDIHDALKVFEKPLVKDHVEVKSGGSWKDPNNFSKTYVSSNEWNVTELHDVTFRQTITLRADLHITNLNLAMAQQWGVLNPASIAWELVPFSFVLDWFVNVGDYLSSLTDFAGITLKNASQTTFTRANGSGYKYEIAIRPASSNTNKEDWSLNNIHCIRTPGLGAGPAIRLRTPKPWGIRRGLAAASLLMQRFPRSVMDANAALGSKRNNHFRNTVWPKDRDYF